MSDPAILSGKISSGYVEESPLLERLSEIVSKMKEGVPVIRKLESCVPGSTEIAMCIAILSDDLQFVKFVRESDGSNDDITVSVLELAAVEQVAVSNADTHAVGLFIPKEELIMELIFASSDEWSRWLTGLKVLCAKTDSPETVVDVDKSASAESCLTEVQDISCMITNSPMSELVGLVNELQNQNEGLKSMLEEYERAVDEVKVQLNEEIKARRSAENEAVRLRKLMLVREDTITELSELVQSLLRKQACLTSMESCPEEFFIGSERKDRKPLRVTNLMRSTPVTTLGETDEIPLVLQGMEEQLRILEQRRHLLEGMLTSAMGQ